MKWKKMAVMLGASGVVFGGVFGFVAFRQHMIRQYFATLPKPVMAVTAIPAVEQTWEAQVSAIGTLEAVNGVDVTTAVSGLVKDIAFQSGQKVRKGELLLRIDADVELADLRSAQADLALAKLTADRKRQLVATNAVSQAAVDQADADLRVKEAKAASVAATIARKTVVAPFDGVLGLRKVDVGQYLQPGAAVVNLQDLSVMLGDFHVSQKDLGRLAVGQAVRVSADAYPGHAFEGTLSTIEPQVDAKSGMVAVQVRLPNPDGLLRPGMFAKVDVLVPGARPVVTVPQSAIAYALHGDTVFVVKDAEGGAKQAARVVVQIGERRDGRVAILSGIVPGDLVVTSGQLKLENGTAVNVGEGDPLKPSATTAVE